MVYRKGELTARRIDRDWPHQVALPADAVSGRNTTIIQRFCRGLSVCPRHRRYGDGENERIAYCFVERLDAEFFQMHFGGEFIEPSGRTK
jgi:hypothetical protein